MTKETRSTFALLACVCTAIFFSGCNTASNSGLAIEASVSALVAPGGDAARQYTLVPGNPDVKFDDLQFREFAEYIERAMALQGFVRASTPESADIFVVAGYGIGDPQTRTVTFALPNWGQTGIASSTTNGTARTTGTLNMSGNYGNYSGTTTYSGTTHYQPTYGITSYSTGVGQVTTYTRALWLVGFDAASIRSRGEPKELWRVSAISIGRSSDLRFIFPYLVAAARNYIGKPTDRAIEMSFAEDDARVVEIRAAPSPTPQPLK